MTWACNSIHIVSARASEALRTYMPQALSQDSCAETKTQAGLSQGCHKVVTRLSQGWSCTRLSQGWHKVGTRWSQGGHKVVHSITTRLLQACYNFPRLSQVNEVVTTLSQGCYNHVHGCS